MVENLLMELWGRRCGPEKVNIIKELKGGRGRRIINGVIGGEMWGELKGAR